MAATTQKPQLGNVLVIGGNGFLGHHVVKQLVAEYDAHVSVIDVRCERNRTDGADYFEADITDGPNLTALFRKLKPEVVIHTASPHPQADGGAARKLFKAVNVDGTTNVVAACRDAGVAALVYTSSASVVSDNLNDLINADERWPLITGEDQTEYYTQTKIEAETIVLAANRKSPHKLLTCSIRPAGIFGEGDPVTTRNLLDVYRQGRNNVQLGSNDNLFEFTYAGNVAHAHLLAARLLRAAAAASSSSPPADRERVDGEAFFVTNDSPVYFWDFARALWRAAGSDQGLARVWVLPREVSLILGSLSETACALVRVAPTFTRQRIVYATMTRYYNIGKAKRVLGYRPRVSLQEGIERSAKWYLAQEAKA